jgi:MBG domain (YGX type)/Immunoglobulin domain/Galactose oxidase, central domain
MKTILNRRFVAFLATGATLAMATLVGGSSSTQVKELSPLVVARTAHAATALTDGRILITGGRDSAGNIVAVSEIFDPATETSTAGATLTTPRVDHTATLLPNGKVLVAGGTGASGSLTSAEIFDPANPAAGFRVLSASMGAARTRHTATLLNNGTVLIAGGDTAGTAEIFDPATESFSAALLAMAAPRIGHTATLFSDDSVLLAGGNTDSMERFTPTDQKFTLDPKAMSAARTGHEAIELSNTRLLFFGGDTGNTIDEFNSSADTLTLKGNMTAAASSATLLANGKILVLGANMAGLYAPDAADPGSAFTAFDETSVPGSTVLKRSGQTATELSGDKRILVAGGVNAQNLSVNPALFNAARIWTDKDDYQPGDQVILSGSGWKANENVYLYAVDSQTDAWTYGSTVAADANGAFVVDPYFVVQLVQLGANFSVTAVGAQSAMQADVKFTDSVGSATITTVNGTPKANFGPPTNFQITYTSLPQLVTVAFTYSTSATGTTTGTLDLVGTTVTASKSLTTGVGPLSDSIAINIPPGTPNGTYNLKATVTNNDGSGANQKNDQVSQAIVINVPACTSPSITTSPSSTTKTVGDSVTFSVSASGTAPLSYQWRKNSVNIGGATTSSYTIPSVVVANAGSYDVVVTNSCGSATSTAAVLTVNKATPTATLAVNNSPQTYTGSGQAATVGITTSSVPGTVANILTGGAATKTNAGTYAVTADFVPNDTANYNTLTGLSAGDFVIQKANANFTVTPYTCPTTTYTGLAHTATASTITGVNGETGATVGTVDVSHTTHTNAGTYASDYWFFTGTANYNDIGNTTITDCIAKANAVVVVTPYTCPTTTYTGLPHTATVTSISGVNGETGATVGTVNVSGTTHIPAGTYNNDPWSFTGGANYNDQNGTVNDCIAKADAVVVVMPYTCPSTTYTGLAHTATVTSISGVNGETGATVGTVNVSGTTHTPAGTYNNDPWSFTGGANYNDQNGTVNDCIAKADATVVVTPYTVTYNGLAHTATYTISGVNGETGVTVGTVDVSNTTHTNAGTYNTDSWSFTGTANYNDIAATTITDTINKAHLTVTADDKTKIYDGAPFTAFTATLSGFVNGETDAGLRGTGDLSGAAGFTGTAVGAFLPGTWVITPTVNTLSATNYDFPTVPTGYFVNGTLTVTFGTCGGSQMGGVILPPINSDGTSVYPRKGGSTIPVKFTVCDANGNPISDPAAVFGSNMGATLSMLSAVRGTVSPVNEEPVITNVPDVGFRYSGGQWIFNMATTNLTQGNTYTFRINLAYGSITFRVGVK